MHRGIYNSGKLLYSYKLLFSVMAGRWYWFDGVAVGLLKKKNLLWGAGSLILSNDHIGT